MLLRALRSPVFWLLSGASFICGATSNGIVGVHFVPHSIDHGIPEVTAAGVLALVADRSGRANVGTAFGWVFFSHQLGGVARDAPGNYTLAFLSAGVLAILGALMALGVARKSVTPAPEPARA